MTDTLDPDLLSPSEIIPAPAEPDPGGIVLSCPICGATKSASGLPIVTKFQLSGHMKAHSGKTGEAKTTKPTKETKPRTPPRKSTARPKTSTAPARARRPLGESIGRIVLQLGRVVNQIEPPTGAVLMFEAGALGEAIDRVVAGTFIDKPLQNAAATASKIEPLVPLVSLPAMIFLASRDPNMGRLFESEIREAIEDVLVQSLPLLKKRAQRTRDTISALEELKAIDPEVYGSGDPIGAILNSFFDGPPAEAPADGED